MSTDSILYAVTSFQRRAAFSEALDTDQKSEVIVATDIMRDFLKREDAEGFSSYIDSGLARWPDRFDFILDGLFDELGITDREELEEELRAT